MKHRKLALFLCAAVLPAAVLLRSAAAEEKKYLALTFDDGPWPETTEKLLDGLHERGAHATFFLIGEQIPGNEALLHRMKAEGHQIGNHSFRHVRLDQSPESAARELRETDELLRRTLGEEGYWIRPPWGFLGQEVRAAAAVPFVHWSVDTQDWQIKDREEVTRRIVEEAKDGDIVLLHDPYATSVDAALEAIDRLGERGFTFVTLEELFDRMGVVPEAGEFYKRPDLKK